MSGASGPTQPKPGAITPPRTAASLWIVSPFMRHAQACGKVFRSCFGCQRKLALTRYRKTIAAPLNQLGLRTQASATRMRAASSLCCIPAHAELSFSLLCLPPPPRFPSAGRVPLCDRLLITLAHGNRLNHRKVRARVGYALAIRLAQWTPSPTPYAEWITGKRS